MAVPATDVDICNLALDHLAQKPIVTLSASGTEISQVCERHYVHVRQTLLRHYVFNFSKKMAVLASNAVVPAYGYSSAYDLPADFIRLLALGDTTINADVRSDLYELVDGDIFTDYTDGTDALNILYIYDATTIANYDPAFVQVFALRLAKAMAYKFTLKPSIKRDLKVDLLEAETAAAAVAGQEKPVRRIQNSRWRRARKFGTTNRNNTRYP